MFWAFWASILGMVLLAIPFASLSTHSETIRDTNWATFKATESSTTIHYFLGLTRVAATCTGDNCKQDATTFALDSSSCVYDFCQDCADAAIGTESGAFLGFITMIIQINGNIGRSTVEGDMNCQKWMGILTGIAGFISTMASLSNFSSVCYKNIPEYENGINIHPALGPSFYCTFFATLLKLFEIFVNVIVPAPPPGEGFDPKKNDVSEIMPTFLAAYLLSNKNSNKSSEEVKNPTLSSDL
jgi:hypothetical protein